MENIVATLFAGVSKADQEKMLGCMGAAEKTYKAGEVVLRFGTGQPLMGIMQSGTAVLERTDYDGTRTVLEQLSTGEAFGDVIAFGDVARNHYAVVCTDSCKVAFITLNQIAKRCSNACVCHNIFIGNMLQIMAQKTWHLSQRVEVLSTRTIRARLMCYFNQLATATNSKKFTLPFSISALADYICVDRSAMSRELRTMQQEGLLEMNRREIQLLQ